MRVCVDRDSASSDLLWVGVEVTAEGRLWCGAWCAAHALRYLVSSVCDVGASANWYGHCSVVVGATDTPLYIGYAELTVSPECR